MIQAFERQHALSDEMKNRLSTITEIKEYPKKHLLLQEGQVAEYACFVIKGLARAFYMLDGKETTSRFMDEGFVITSWISFYTRKPGYEYIETMEDSLAACTTVTFCQSTRTLWNLIL